MLGENEPARDQFEEAVTLARDREARAEP